MSLYKTLLNQTTNHDYTSLDKLYEIGKGHKQSYIERELRRICEDTGNKAVCGYCIFPVMARNGKGVEYIIGYQRSLEKSFNL